MQSHGVDSLQSAVLSPQQKQTALGGTLRRGASASAENLHNGTGTWKKDKVWGLQLQLSYERRAPSWDDDCARHVCAITADSNRQRDAACLQAASDPMDAACDAVALSWVLRRALGLLSMLEVENTPEALTTRIKAGGIMDVVES